MPSAALIFHGPTQHPAAKNLRNALCVFGGGQPNPNFGGAIFDQLYLMMSSEGGSIEEAFALYNLLMALPAKIITVNMGQIASAGNIPFLAGDERWSCPQSYFHFHNLSWTYTAPQMVQRMQLADHAQILDIERSLYKEIFKARTTLTDDDFESLHFIEQPMVKGTGFAQEKGIIHHIGIPTLPAGTPIFNVDY
jgi:ATP-dependent Clp protease, protease subunit